MTELLPGGRSAAAAASTSSLALPPFLNVADHILPWLRTFMRPSAASAPRPLALIFWSHRDEGALRVEMKEGLEGAAAALCASASRMTTLFLPFAICCSRAGGGGDRASLRFLFYANSFKELISGA